MLEPTIIHETNQFLAIDKPAGLMVHGVRVSERRRRMKPQETTLVDWLRQHRPEIRDIGDDPVLRPGIVHRLDKETSGVMLVAKNQEYFEYLKSLFQTHRIQKTYYALVFGILKEKQGLIDAPIGIVTGTLKRSIRSRKMQKEAVTEYSIIPMHRLGFEDSSAYSLLEVYPRTGRTHQIRVHLASIGHPIVGDRLYAPKSKKNFHRLMLHAFAIEFAEKNGSMVRVEAAVPRDFSLRLSTDIA